MSDPRDPNFDYRNPENHIQRSADLEPDSRASNAAWGWIAAAVFLVVVLAVAFGIGHQPGDSATQTALNNPTPTPPAANHMTPPTFAPAPATSAPPIAPQNAPTQSGTHQ